VFDYPQLGACHPQGRSLALSSEEFRAAVIARHAPAFELHQKVLVEMERAINKDRDLSDLVSRAVDMLFVQAFKSLTSARELASLALSEDAATLTRRLMELAVRSIFIARDSEEQTRLDRAGSYLADLWSEWPADSRAVIPEAERKAWETIASAYPQRDANGKRRRRPTIKEQFEYAEQPETYTQDYSYLSSISHGLPPAFVHQYSQGIVQIHDDREVPRLLVFATSYGLVTFLVWQEHFGIPDVPAEELMVRVRTARDAL
jgi:hypothetical protein